MNFRRKGEKGAYAFLDSKCIGAVCWAPGEHQTRGATPSGSRATGEATKCCMRRAYHGCPDAAERLHTIERKKERQSEGWKAA